GSHSEHRRSERCCCPIHARYPRDSSERSACALEQADCPAESSSPRANLKAKEISGNNWRTAAVYAIAILFGRCVGEMLPWSSLESIGRLFWHCVVRAW